MALPAILCYGVIGVDRLIRVSRFPERDGHARILEEMECIGGEAANTAVSLCGLGHRVRLAGNAIGNDSMGAFLRSELQGVGGLELCRLEASSDATTGHAVILSDPDGARTILGAFPDLTAPPIRESDLEGVRLLSVDPFLGDEAVRTARLAKAKGLSIVSIELTGDHPLSEFAEVVINSSGFIRRHEMGEPDEIARDLLSAGVQTFVLTRGGEGSVVYTRDDRVEVPAFSVNAVDTTGAGDAFRAGLIHGILMEAGLMQSVRIGSASAALTCGGIGGCGHLGDLESVLAMAGQA